MYAQLSGLCPASSGAARFRITKREVSYTKVPGPLPSTNSAPHNVYMMKPLKLRAGSGPSFTQLHRSWTKLKPQSTVFFVNLEHLLPFFHFFFLRLRQHNN